MVLGIKMSLNWRLDPNSGAVNARLEEFGFICQTNEVASFARQLLFIEQHSDTPSTYSMSFNDDINPREHAFLCPFYRWRN